MQQIHHQISELDQTIMPWLGRATKALDISIAEQFTHHQLDLTKAQMILLRRLVVNDGIPQHSLAFITYRDKTSLTRLVHTMEKKGLVTRKLSKDDKRINLVYITDLGREALQNAFPILKKMIEVIQTGIDKEDLKTAIKVLKQISNNINADELTAPLTHTKQ